MASGMRVGVARGAEVSRLGRVARHAERAHSLPIRDRSAMKGTCGDGGVRMKKRSGRSRRAAGAPVGNGNSRMGQREAVLDAGLHAARRAGLECSL